MRGSMAAWMLLPTTAWGQFSAEEAEQIRQYWSVPGRYTTGVPSSAARNGLWQVRTTPEGSLWLWQYQRARGLGGKIPPGQNPPVVTETDRLHEAWIDAKVAWDRMQAQVQANQLNQRSDPVAAVGDPGPIPPSLAALAGNPPPFANVVAPVEHVIAFHDDALRYTDNPNMRPRYAFYRFPQGVMSGGTRVADIPRPEMEALLRAGGIDGSQLKVLLAVSVLEGGFDSVNTYDTGFVSVGFIQFAALSGGSGSLGEMLLRFKTEMPEAFQRDLRAYGLDVTPQGVLMAIDIETGATLLGPEASAKIIQDKRLIAVFQRAGRRSAEFRLAQLRHAMARFYPANDDVSLVLGGQVVFSKISDIVRSEAGMATLFDRKVNTGNIRVFAEVATRIANERGARTAEEVAALERDIIAALRYRRDFLSDASLTQPSSSRG